jgi:hypothetical protein
VQEAPNNPVIKNKIIGNKYIYLIRSVNGSVFFFREEAIPTQRMENSNPLIRNEIPKIVFH